MICPECNGRGETTYYVETDRDENTVTVVARKDICHTCNGSGKMPMTNADRIRAMSDEELHDLLVDVYNAGVDDSTAYAWGNYKNSFEWTEKWLKQPAED